MGMFDNIICEHKLPGSPNVKEWQTKDTPDQYLSKYTITKDGCLNQDGKPLDYTREIHFYGIDQAGRYREYRATFLHGNLVEKIKEIRANH